MRCDTGVCSYLDVQHSRSHTHNIPSNSPSNSSSNSNRNNSSTSGSTRSSASSNTIGGYNSSNNSNISSRYSNSNNNSTSDSSSNSSNRNNSSNSSTSGSTGSSTSSNTNSSTSSYSNSSSSSNSRCSNNNIYSNSNCNSSNIISSNYNSKTNSGGGDNTLGGGERGMLAFGDSLAGREGQNGCVTLRVWGTVLTPYVLMGRAVHGLGFDWWSILWERLSSLRRPDPRWVAEAPEWGVFVSFAVLDLWKDRRAPTLSHYILWLMRRRTRRTRRGHRSLNWIKTQAGKLRRRKAHTRPPSPVARLLLSALCRVRWEWRLLRFAVSLVGSAIQVDGPLLWIGMSLLVLLSLLWRAVTPWDLRPSPADPKHPTSVSPSAWTGGCANGNAPAYEVEDEDACWDDEVMEGDDDWAWNRGDEEDEDWDFPEVFIPHDQLYGGCADATSSTAYEAEAQEVDTMLVKYRARRVANSHITDCGLLAIHASGWRSATPDFSADRKDIGDMAVKLEREMRSILQSGEALTRWIDGIRGSAKVDHLALRLFALRRDINIVVVQAGENPVVLIAPGSMNITNAQQRAAEVSRRTTVAIALCDGHYEAIRPTEEEGDVRDVSSALLRVADRATLNPLDLDQRPLPTSNPSGEALELCLGKPEEDFCFCPVEGCKRGIIAQTDVNSFTREGLLAHLRIHASQKEYIPEHILSFFGFKRCVSEECPTLLKKSQSACRSCTHLMKKAPLPGIEERLTHARCPEGMPSLDMLGTTRLKMKGTCPPDLLHRYTLIFQRVLQEILVHQDKRAWTKLAFFFTVLHRDRGGGRAGSQDAKRRCYNSWRQDLDWWDAGEWADMWEKALSEVQARPKWTPGDTVEARQKRSRAKTAAGLPGQALSALTSDGLAPHGPDTLAKLKGKHPTAAPPTASASSPLRNTSGPADFTPKEVLAAISSMPRATAGGPSNLTGSLLRTLCNQKHTPGTLAALSAVLSSLAQGKARREVAPFFAGAKLVALRKVSKGKPDDVRPIAVGGVLRRLVGKILANRLRKRAAEIFRKGNQVGVSTPRGSEAATTMIAQYAKRHDGQDKVILKVDYHNAFNTVDRSTFLDAVEKHIPEISPWVRWCYGGHTSLFYGEDILTSQTGVQQGDPLGPVLFSLAIADMTEKLKANKALDGSIWYLDDGCIRGSPEAVKAAYDALVVSSKQVGLKVNSSKCELVTLRGDSAADLRDRGFVICDEPGSPGFTLHQKNFDFLGIPIGTAEHCRKYMQRKLDESKRNLEALKDLKDSQHAFYILRFCEGFCKMVFYMRGISCVDLGEDYLRDFDAEVDKCLATILHDEHGTIPELARLQAALPIAIGGLGVRRTADHWPAAVLASQAGCFKLATQLDPNFEWDQSRWKNAAEAFNRRVAVSHHIDGDVKPSKLLVQQELSSAIVDHQAAELKRRCSSERDRARLLSLQLPLSGTWLTAAPTPPNTIRSDYFAGAMRFRLGVAIHKPNSVCKGCNPKGGRMDAFGDHTFACASMGCRTDRHDALKHAFALICEAAGLNPSVEKNLGFESGKRPADVYLPLGIYETSARALDFTVAAPTLPTYVHRAAQHREYAAKVAGEGKRKKHAEDCKSADVLFSPMVFEAFGGASEECNRVISQVAGLAGVADPGGDSPTETRLRERLSCAYQATVGKSFRARGVLCTDIGQHVPHCADAGQGPSEEMLQQMDSDYLHGSADNLPNREPSVEVVDDDDEDESSEPRAFFAMPEKKVGGVAYRVNPIRVNQTIVGETPEDCWNSLRSMADGRCPKAETQAARLGLTHPPRFEILRGDSGFDALLAACSTELKRNLKLEDTSTGSKHLDLRRRAVKKISSDRPDLVACIPISAKSWMEHMGSQSSDRSDARTWVDEVALAGAGEVLECTIVLIGSHMRPRILTPTRPAKEVLFLLVDTVDDSADWFCSPLFVSDPGLKSEILSMEPTPAPKSRCKSDVMMDRVPTVPAPGVVFDQCRRCFSPFDSGETHYKCTEGCGRKVCVGCARDSPFCPASQAGLVDILRGNKRGDSSDTHSPPDPQGARSEDVQMEEVKEEGDSHCPEDVNMEGAEEECHPSARTHQKGAERSRSPPIPSSEPTTDARMDDSGDVFLQHVRHLAQNTNVSATSLFFSDIPWERLLELMGARARDPFTIGDCLFDAVSASFPSSARISSATLRQIAVAQVLRDSDLRSLTGGHRSWAMRKLQAGCTDPSTWGDLLLVSGLSRALNVTFVLFCAPLHGSANPGSCPHVIAPRGVSCGVIGLTYTGVVSGHFERFILNADTAQAFCEVQRHSSSGGPCAWKLFTGSFRCGMCKVEGASADDSFMSCTCCCTTSCLTCAVGAKCSGPSVPMDSHPAGPQGIRAYENPLDGNTPDPLALARVHAAETTVVRQWWAVRTELKVCFKRNEALAVGESAEERRNALEHLKEECAREEAEDMLALANQQASEVQVKMEETSETDIPQSTPQEQQVPSSAAEAQTGETPVRHPAPHDETPPMPPSSRGDWEQADTLMQDMHETDASPQPVTPPCFAAEPEDRESGFEGGVEGDVPPEEGEELRRRSAERRRLSEERQKQEREATEVLLRRARSESASRFVSAKAKSSEQRRETMQEKAMGVRSPAGAQPGSAKTSELTKAGALNRRQAQSLTASQRREESRQRFRLGFASCEEQEAEGRRNIGNEESMQGRETILLHATSERCLLLLRDAERSHGDLRDEEDMAFSKLCTASCLLPQAFLPRAAPSTGEDKKPGTAKPGTAKQGIELGDTQTRRKGVSQARVTTERDNRVRKARQSTPAVENPKADAEGHSGAQGAGPVHRVPPKNPVHRVPKNPVHRVLFSRGL